jgi:putative PIN family toxin of toxin-antitoxin system
MGEIKVVIDTNVIISAILFDGIPGELIPLWKSSRIKPLASKEIIDEYIKVLAYPKFELSEAEINYILYNEILTHFDIIQIKESPMITKVDPSDDKFIHCTKAGKANLIISGDQHLLKLKSYGKIKIQTPSQFLKKFGYNQQPANRSPLPLIPDLCTSDHFPLTSDHGPLSSTPCSTGIRVYGKTFKETYKTIGVP